jgi:IS30 family transposase
MSTQYNHLSTEERVTIMVMLFLRQTLRAIARLLGRRPSTISREFRRNSQQPKYTAIQTTSTARYLRHAPLRQRRLFPDSELFQWLSKCSVLADHRNKLPADYVASGLANPRDM